MLFYLAQCPDGVGTPVFSEGQPVAEEFQLALQQFKLAHF